jgi:selenium metabolism protein YedF
MKTIDAKGKLCPLPLIMTKKALQEIQENETLLVLMDNEISVKNVTRFLEDTGLKPKTERKGEVFELIVNKTGTIPENIKAEDYCEIEDNKAGNYVVAVLKNRLGEGSEELGEFLIKGFINTLPEASIKPKTIAFMNGGIFLTIAGSQVLEALKKLENTGVEILVCGACLDFYNKKEELAVGRISNMYEIIERLTLSGKVIYT